LMPHLLPISPKWAMNSRLREGIWSEMVMNQF